MQSSVHLQVSRKPPYVTKRRTASEGGQLDSGSSSSIGVNDVMDEMMADFDSADLTDNRPPAGFLAEPGMSSQSTPASSPSYPPSSASSSRVKPPSSPPSYSEIDCLINDQDTVPCLKSGTEVYVPFFGFLRKYFEVYGKMSKGRDGQERFEWQHSYSRVYYPRKKYDPQGSFLWFENYNVEVRDRVKCISGMEGVPVSTQWNPQGHIYPIQVAQFGLSHFSKNLTEKPPIVIILDNGYVTNKSKWIVAQEDIGTEGGPAEKKIIAKVERNDGIVHFETEGPSSDSSVSLSMDESLPGAYLSLDVLFAGNGSISCVLSEAGKSTIYTVRYVTTDALVESRFRDVVYGIGSVKSFKTLTRDLRIDLIKGLSLLQPKKKVAKLRNLILRAVEFRGKGSVSNVTLWSSAHVASFFAACDWLVRNQDEKGGWPIMVTRKLSNGVLELKPGWYSAMAQGQAMSVLTRAFGVTKNLSYLEAALKATKLFNVRSEHRGVMTTFLGKYVWYEEYPTTPSSFVLNGFIYSLIGLYDLKSSCTHVSCKEASRLFDEGMVSLKKMLSFFDTGSGSIYDLRHFSLGVAPNLARWDYHTTHINQLLLLSTIDQDPILSTTAQRWIGYMNGKRASHN